LPANYVDQEQLTARLRETMGTPPTRICAAFDKIQGPRSESPGVISALPIEAYIPLDTFGQDPMTRGLRVAPEVGTRRGACRRSRARGTQARATSMRSSSSPVTGHRRAEASTPA